MIDGMAWRLLSREARTWWPFACNDDGLLEQAEKKPPEANGMTPEGKRFIRHRRMFGPL